MKGLVYYWREISICFIVNLQVSISCLCNDSVFKFQIWVHGNSFESFLVAVANPNQQALEHWAQEHGTSGDFKSLCENPNAKEYILGELTKIGKEKKVPAEFALVYLSLNLLNDTVFIFWS